jgi:hypothetical protein
MARGHREGAGRPVRWLNIAGPSKWQLTAAIGDRECDRFLKATRAVIIEVVRESRNAIVRDQNPDQGHYRPYRRLS